MMFTDGTEYAVEGNNALSSELKDSLIGILKEDNEVIAVAKIDLDSFKNRELNGCKLLKGEEFKIDSSVDIVNSISRE